MAFDNVKIAVVASDQFVFLAKKTFEKSSFGHVIMAQIKTALLFHVHTTERQPSKSARHDRNHKLKPQHDVSSFHPPYSKPADSITPGMSKCLRLTSMASNGNGSFEPIYFLSHSNTRSLDNTPTNE